MYSYTVTGLNKQCPREVVETEMQEEKMHTQQHVAPRKFAICEHAYTCPAADSSGRPQPHG